jgi:hypothetical protein
MVQQCEMGVTLSFYIYYGSGIRKKEGMKKVKLIPIHPCFSCINEVHIAILVYLIQTIIYGLTSQSVFSLLFNNSKNCQRV